MSNRTEMSKRTISYYVNRMIKKEGFDVFIGGIFDGFRGGYLSALVDMNKTVKASKCIQEWIYEDIYEFPVDKAWNLEYWYEVFDNYVRGKNRE